MEIKDIPLTEIKPYEKNNKKHNEEAIKTMARSLELYGWTLPIVVDEQMVILAGHRRYFAAKYNNLKTVPVHQVIGLDDARKKQYRIVDNKLSSSPVWDYAAIEVELIELSEANLDVVEFSLDEFLEIGNDLKSKEINENDSEGTDKSGDVGYSVQYTFVFDNEIQQSRFYDFMRELKGKYNGETAAARFDEFLDDHWG